MEASKELKNTLDRAKVALLRTDNSVFLTTVLFSLKQKWEMGLPTAAVSSKVLYLNPDFWQAQNERVRVSILAHETWHVAFNHLDTPDTINKKIHNQAGDFVINLMLKDAGFEVPNTWLCDEKYRGMHTMEVYHLLLKNPPPASSGGAGGAGDDIGQDIQPSTGTPEERERARQEVADILIKAATLSRLQGDKPGSIPGDIEIMLDELINPKLDWTVILQNYMTSFAKDDYTFKRPNRRYAPEFHLPSAHSESCGEICVAVDTSGSVSTDDFMKFISEINSIKEKLSPSLTTIIDFDTSIKHVHRLGPDETVQGLPFAGRGGTSLDCVFDYYDKNRPIVLIVFSDLYCSQLQEDPGYPIIWICCDNPGAEVNLGKLIHYDTSS